MKLNVLVQTDCKVVVSEDTVLKVFNAINARKTCGADGVCGRVLKYCAKELCDLSLHFPSVH